MRDIERINIFTAQIKKLWEKYCPDWRFSQLMVNFFSWLDDDPFYIEDEILLEKFEKFFYLNFPNVNPWDFEEFVPPKI